LCLSASRGYWVNLIRVKKAAVLSRRRHPQPVHGYVIKRSWRYFQHDWIATEGAYVYEAPSETHTLAVDAGVTEMITMFQVNRAMIYVDTDGVVKGCEVVFTKIDLYRKHLVAIGFGEYFVDQFNRQYSTNVWVKFIDIYINGLYYKSLLFEKLYPKRRCMVCILPPLTMPATPRSKS